MAAIAAAAALGARAAETARVPSPAPADAEQTARATVGCMKVAVELYENGALRAAASAFEKVLRLDPANTAAERYLADCERALGK